MRRVCVFTGSNSGFRPIYRKVAEELGRTLAERHLGLVYGGARIGLMGILANAVLGSGGDVTGVIPAGLVEKEVGHNGVADLRVVGSMHERKALMADLADGFVALPGGWGTLDEFFEILTWGQLGLHQKPCGLLNVHGYFDSLLSFVEHSITEGFLRREHGSMIQVSTSPGAILDMLASYEPPTLEKWIDLGATHGTTSD